MVNSSCYLLRSNGRGYDLRSKAFSRPSTQNFQFKISRGGGKHHHVRKISPTKKAPKAVKRKADLEDIYFGKHAEVEEMAREFADAAMAYLNEDGCNYVLVRPGLYSGDVISGGSQFHYHNFKAKRADDPNAPLETFFSQVFSHSYPSSKGLEVQCCVSLGESDSLPEKRDNQGCLFCDDSVHHPVGGCEGINVGWPSWSYIEELDMKILAEMEEEEEEED